MSIQAVAWALEQDLPARPKLVLVSIANHANHVDGYCWLKAETIAKEAACKPRSIYNFVGSLIRNGFIRKELRKGDDGKQRATDYWILFDREETPWDKGAHPEPDEGEGEADDSETILDQPQDVEQPSESHAGGENDETPPTEPVDIPAGAYGPSATACHRKRIAEPSKTKPKKIGDRENSFAGPPRGYRPPPPQPLGATVEGPAKQIFVYEGSRAWDAWVEYKKKTTGVRWSLSKSHFVDGKHRSGWWFPSLFPPDAPEPTDLTDAEAKEFADTG